MHVLPPRKGAVEKTEADEVPGESKDEVEDSTSQTQMQSNIDPL
jgi:hypothetical protein